MSGGVPDALPPALIVVDDEVDHAAIVRRLLVDLAPALPVEVVTDASGLIERLSEAPHHALLLLDRMLDGREALDVVSALAVARPDLTVAVLSAALSEHDRERALAAGADHAAQKPGSIADWRALLTDLLAHAGRRRGAVA